jgi:hypothetical protein
LGDKEGALEGAAIWISSVGGAEGVDVGFAGAAVLGCKEGWTVVADKDGISDGVAARSSDGFVEGVELDLLKGETDGTFEGVSVWVSYGCAEGIKVGVLEGEGVGAEDKEGLLDRVGARVGLSVGTA